MEVNLTEVAPTKPTYQLNLTLTHDELRRLGVIMGNICGGGPSRILANKLYEFIKDKVGYGGHNQIEQGMTLTGN